MRILITGITGRIGANLAAALVAQGHEVRGLVWGGDARTEKLRPLGVELIEGNLTEAADVARAVEGMDVIYHLGGAFQGGGPFSTEDYFQINVRGTFLMLEAARGMPRRSTPTPRRVAHGAGIPSRSRSARNCATVTGAPTGRRSRRCGSR